MFSCVIVIRAARLNEVNTNEQRMLFSCTCRESCHLNAKTMDLIYTFVLFATSFSLGSCTVLEYCEPITVKSCSNAGYALTARFPDVDGTPYQDFQASRLNLYIPLLQLCSPYVSTILCSLYLPKCEEGRRDPWLPCYKVCTKFVMECQSLLQKAGLVGMFTVLCDQLPDGDSQSNKCFYPPNFNSSSSGGKC